jgi:hypothetical protein
MRKLILLRELTETQIVNTETAEYIDKLVMTMTRSGVPT